ncbi:hypothetical protein CCMA1212_005754 [Trichoderma ghanense]|uniref:Uncharacterized protein n=1 Tax=Trichoderma ghanense TaxID=65468 RepID=A0ABY2H5C4_9HYPO
MAKPSPPTIAIPETLYCELRRSRSKAARRHEMLLSPALLRFGSRPVQRQPCERFLYHSPWPSLAEDLMSVTCRLWDVVPLQKKRWGAADRMQDSVGD